MDIVGSEGVLQAGQTVEYVQVSFGMCVVILYVSTVNCILTAVSYVMHVVIFICRLSF